MSLYHVYEKLYGKILDKKPTRRRFNFEIHLRDSCNLNCVGCFHFAPLAEENTYYPIEDFEKDIQRLSSLFHGKFGWVHICLIRESTNI